MMGVGTASASARLRVMGFMTNRLLSDIWPNVTDSKSDLSDMENSL